MSSRTSAAATAEPGRLTRAEYEEISRFARSHFGLDLRAGKEELVTARLGKRLRQGGFKTYGEYLKHAFADGSGRGLLDLIDALTTNHTSFMREPVHFDLLQSLVAGEFRGVRNLRVWSAACSTGEEPYTIAGALAAGARLDPQRWEILATDISTRVLDVARRGIYPATAVTTLPPAWTATVFERAGSAEAGYRVRPQIAARVRFERLNLLGEDRMPCGFHVIFCRNVMIYFDRVTQQKVVERLARGLEPGGYLFVGHSESLNGLSVPLEYVRPATYRRRAEGRSRNGARL